MKETLVAATSQLRIPRVFRSPDYSLSTGRLQISDVARLVDESRDGIDTRIYLEFRFVAHAAVV